MLHLALTVAVNVRGAYIIYIINLLSLC